MSDDHRESDAALKPQELDMHRAIISLIEEAEAVDWYNERIALASDEQLRRLLSHNANEEKEHLSMLLEWIRRRDNAFDENLRTYLFTTKDILEIEADSEGGGESGESSGGASGKPPRWTVGSLKDR
ncbi:MAG: ferritin [Myxococcales bacterium]|jgi:ferritin-like protein|nr:ferritin [Myxococcales bacterium]